MKPATESPISILLVDDDEDDYLITKRVIERIPDSRFNLDWCSSFEDAREQIAEGFHDLYLIDYQLGERTGFELLEEAEPDKRREPFILLTGATDRELEKRAVTLGASDYLVKGTFGAELLSRSLRYALGRKEAEAQRLQHLIGLNQAKDEFISVASHQLRTPATGVKQYLGMLIEGMLGEVPDSQKAVLEKAYESNERQLKIVSDLLKVARVDAGKVMLKKAKTDINQLMAEVVREEAEITKPRKQAIRFIPKKGVPAVAHVDRDTVRMVFENLIDNASKYSNEGAAIDVRVKTSRHSVTVQITDEGVGIDAEDLDRLFEKFSRIHNPLSMQAGGSGLGLYWAKKIIDLHNGTIEVRSKLNKGTAFVIDLPKSP